MYSPNDPVNNILWLLKPYMPDEVICLGNCAFSLKIGRNKNKTIEDKEKITTVNEKK